MADEIAAYIEALPEATAFPENVERFPPPWSICRMKKNLNTLFMRSASSPSIPSMWVKFSTRPSCGLESRVWSFLPPLKWKILAMSSGILATKFIESVLKSPVVSEIPSASMPVESQSIGWPVPGVRDSKTLRAPVGISSALWASSARKSLLSSSVGRRLLKSR